jgi:NAD(P)-dependent dehydrogenase (short-subunit alcohol dehydrogenase family)
MPSPKELARWRADRADRPGAGRSRARARARIVSLSSSAHLHSPVVFGDLDFRFRPYDPRQAYAESKTAAVLLAVEATRRWAGDGIYANAGGARPGLRFSRWPGGAWPP